MVTLQANYSPGSAGGNINVITVTSPATSSVLVAQLQGWSPMPGINPINIVSIVDNASGGSNVWKFSTATANQNPPVNGSFSVAHSQYGYSAVAWCLPSDNGGSIKAFTALTITITEAGGTSFQEGGVGEYTGMPANTIAVVAASTGVLATTTSYTTPALTLAGTCLVVCATSCFDNPSAVSPGWVLDNDGNPISAHNLAAAAGSVSCTFTMPSDDVPSSAIVAFGAPSAPPAGLDGAARLILGLP